MNCGLDHWRPCKENSSKQYSINIDLWEREADRSAQAWVGDPCRVNQSLSLDLFPVAMFHAMWTRRENEVSTYGGAKTAELRQEEREVLWRH